MSRALRGAKGGHTPVEASDTLRSTQRAEIVDVLGEGQIGGLVNGLKSVFLDGVPVENADGSRNFKDFGLDLTLGGPTDTAPAHGFGDVQTETAVGVTVTVPLPVVRTVADATVDQVRVTITVPALVENKDNGDRVGASFEWAIDVQSNGGGYVEKHHATISGKASNAYQRAVLLDLAAAGPAPWQIRVRRITADSTSSNLVNAFSWTSYTTISGVRMQYRHTARAKLTFDAQNFSSTPVRAYDVMGISDWDIPVNYDAIARSYTGLWNGTFKQGWTNNPAWVLYNLVKHQRYGLGQYVTQLPDKWLLYQLAQWCDVAVPDGRGGNEPRYTMNAYIVQQADALRMLQDICAVFRGALLYTNTLAVSWDQPGTPVAIYTPANVVDGNFNYAEGSRTAKKSSCTCWYNDRSQFGKRMPATWDEPSLVAKYGLRSMEIEPIGVGSPGQALRMAKWALWTTEMEDGTVSFRVGSQGAAGRVGEVFQVTDPSETGERLGGRVHAATTTQVTLDAEVVLAAGQTYTLWVTLADPADPAKLIAQQRTVTTGAGTHTVLTVASAFSAAPMAQTMWLLEGSDVAPTLWRYLSIQEVRGQGNQLEYEIVGLRHEPGKWDLIEANQPLTTRPTRRLAETAPVPTGLTITETNYVDAGVDRIRATIGWTMPAMGLSYQVAWRLNNGPWAHLSPTTHNTVDVDGLAVGTFEVQVQSRNVLGSLSAVAEAWLPLTGTASLPPNVGGPTATTVSAGVRIDWTPYDAPTAGETEIRSGASWDAGTRVFRGRASTYTMVAPPAGTYTLWLKHFDATGVRQSLTAQSVGFAWDGVSIVGVLTLVASSQIFRVDVNGAAVPTSVTLTATGQNLAGSPSFSIVSGTATLTGTGNTRQVAYSSMSTESITVQCTWDGRVDQVSIFKLRDGSDAYSFGLANENQAVACDSAGTPLAGQLPLSSFGVVLRGSTLLTSGVVYAVAASSGLSGVSIGASTGTIAVTGMTADSGYADFTATIGSTVLTKTLRVNKVKAGAAGTPGVSTYTLEIYSSGISATPTSSTATYNFSTDTFTAGNLTAGWTRTRPTPSGTTPIYVSRQTLTTTTPGTPVAANTWGTPVVVTQNGAAGAIGNSTALVYAYKRAASAPTDNPGAVTFDFGTNTISSPTTLANGWLKTIPAGSNPLYVEVATAASNTGSDSIAAGEWSSPVLLVQDGAAGTPGAAGLNSATVELFQRTATNVAPALPTGTITYTFATAGISGTPGNGWLTAVPSSGGAYLWVTRGTAASTGATDTIASGEWSAAGLLSQNGADGAPGDPGTPGANGTRTARLRVYQWSTARPTVFPSGTSTYTWSDGSYTLPSTPDRWTLLPGDPVPGTFLWTCQVAYADQGTSATSTVTWASLTAFVEGAAGTDASAAPQTAVYEAKLYYRNATKPATPSGGSYNFETDTLTPPSGGLWSATEPSRTVSQTTPTWTVSYRFITDSSRPYATLTAGAWSEPQINHENDGNGATNNVYYLELFCRNATEPTLPAHTSTAPTYNFNSDSFTLGDLASSPATSTAWGRTRDTATATLNVYRTRVRLETTAPGTNLTITAWGQPVLVTRKGKDTRAPLIINAANFSISGVAWTDGYASRAIRNALTGETDSTSLGATTLNKQGDEVTITYLGTSTRKTWNGSAWSANTVYFGADVLSAGTIGAGVSFDTDGYIVARGYTSTSVADPSTGSGSAQNVVGAFNISDQGRFGVFARTADNSGVGVYAYSAGTASGAYAMQASGPSGLRAYARHADGFAVRGIGKLTSGGTGGGGWFEAAGTNGVALKVSGNVDPIGGGSAKGIECNGEMSITKRLTSTVTGEAAMVFTPQASTPTAVNGGFAVHATWGLIVSDGTNWYRPNASLIPI